MKFSFFKYFADWLFSKFAAKPGGPKTKGELHRKLKRNVALQSIAHDHAKQRRLMAWQRSVQGGYQAKIALVKAGKGRNSLAGIPA